MNYVRDCSIRPCELFWIEHQPYLLENGYKLPPRYDPNWIPSWETNKRLNPISCSDSQGMSPGIPVLDAIRISDGKKVVLKLVEVHKDVPIMEYLNSSDLADDPRNHTVPLLDKISVPHREDVVWIVIPFLIFFQSPSHPFRYVSEVVELAHQFLEGLEFMHEHGIAHRDACTFNLMVESRLVPDGDISFFRPNKTEDWKSRVNRVQRGSVPGLRYYFIDFESSCHFTPDDPNPRCVGLVGQERNIPEMSATIPYNPFKTDVYQLGKAFELLREWNNGVEFLLPLCEAMTRQDPDKRPSAAEAHQLLLTIISSFTDTDMNRPVWYRSTRPSTRPKTREPPPSSSFRIFSFLRLNKLTFLDFKLVH